MISGVTNPRVLEGSDIWVLGGVVGCADPEASVTRLSVCLPLFFFSGVVSITQISGSSDSWGDLVAAVFSVVRLLGIAVSSVVSAVPVVKRSEGEKRFSVISMSSVVTVAILPVPLTVSVVSVFVAAVVSVASAVSVVRFPHPAPVVGASQPASLLSRCVGDTSGSLTLVFRFASNIFEIIFRVSCGGVKAVVVSCGVDGDTLGSSCWSPIGGPLVLLMTSGFP